MLEHYLSPLALAFAAFRLAFVLSSLGAALLLWRRPRPLLAVWAILGLHLAAAAAYFAPLERPYALDEGTDRAFNVGMAACVAAGGSPFEHTQVGFPSPEPFWNALVALLAGQRPEHAAAAYAALTPLSLVAVGLGLYRGLRRDGSDEDAWERVLWVFAVLGLSSLSMHPRPPTPAFWAGNFLLKPNHAAALGLVGLAAGMSARARLRPLVLGLVMGLLAWAFLLDWAYLLVGLFAGMLLRPRAERDWKGLVLATALSSLIALPYVTHLLRGYSPMDGHEASQHMWSDPRGLPLAVPNWSTLDLGPLLVLAALGAWHLRRRGGPLDRAVLGLLAGTWGIWLVSVPAALWGIAPEPDEVHYFLRFAMALAAGAALAAAARHVESVGGLRAGQGHVLALAACVPFSFPAYWDPPNMDRYYSRSLLPLRPKVVSYARWVRENTPASAVFLAGRSAATWIPALGARKVLLAEAGMLLPPDHAARKHAERVLLTSDDASLVRRTAAAWGITHVAIDEPLQQEYGVDSFYRLAASPAYRTVLANSAVRIAALQPPEAAAEAAAGAAAETAR